VISATRTRGGKTGIGGTLFCITGDNQLWWRPPVEVDTNWTPIGMGPGAETKALGSAGGMLYAGDTAGVLGRTAARRAAPAWAAMTFFAGD
jgi:hypothetical protein